MIMAGEDLFDGTMSSAYNAVIDTVYSMKLTVRCILYNSIRRLLSGVHFHP